MRNSISGFMNRGTRYYSIVVRDPESHQGAKEVIYQAGGQETKRDLFYRKFFENVHGWLSAYSHLSPPILFERFGFDTEPGLYMAGDGVRLVFTPTGAVEDLSNELIEKGDIDGIQRMYGVIEHHNKLRRVGGLDQHAPTVILSSPYGFEGAVETRHIGLKAAKAIVNRGYVSAVGHKGSAEIASAILGLPVGQCRFQSALRPGQSAIAIRLKERQPEGAILDRETVERIGYDLLLQKRLF